MSSEMENQEEHAVLDETLGVKLWSTVEVYQNELEAENEVKENLRAVTKELDKAVKRIGFELTAMHVHPTDEKLNLLGQKTMTLIKNELVPRIAKLGAKIPAGDYYKYYDIWRFTSQRVCSMVTLSHYLVHNNLPLMKEVAAHLEIPVTNGKDDTPKSMFLDYEEYIFGMLDLSNELSRLCRNLISFGGNPERAYQIHQLMMDLTAGMHNVTFKNDYLRKKYDGLKYHLKTVEEVIYDLKLQSSGTKPAIGSAKDQAQEINGNANANAGNRSPSST